MKTKTKRGLIGVIGAWVILIAAILASLIIVVLIAKNGDDVQNFITRLGLLGPALSILLYAVLGASPIPSDPLSFINGAIFGPIFGTLISWIGNMLAAYLEYFIGHKIANLTEFEEKKQRLPWGLGKFPADSAWFLLLARFIPEYGGKIVSVIGGLYQVPLWRYTWTAAISTLLGSAFFALSGYGLIQLL